MKRPLTTFAQLYERFRQRAYYRRTRARRLWLKKLRRCGVGE
jgi:hypothetical protein